MSRPVRVLHVLAVDDWGGTEVQVSELLRRSDGLRVHHALAVLDPRGTLHRELAELGVEVHPLAGRGGRLGAQIRLARLLARVPFDLIEAYGFRAGMVTRVARVIARRRTPLLMGVRGLHFAEAEDPDDRRTRLVLAVERALGGTVTAYDANSRGAQRFLTGRGFPADRFAVIYNGVRPVPGVSPEELAERPVNPVPVIACVARFVPRKRHTVLLDALARLRADGHDLRCVLIGHGPTEAAVKQLAEELDLTECVDFAGRLAQPEVLERLRTSDVFVLCSLWEGMPGSVLEASAAGLPVVATRVNGTEEAVRDDETGLLVAVDDAAALAEALAQLLTDPQRRRRMGLSGLRMVTEEHSFARLVTEKEDLFTRVLQTGRP